MSETAPPFEHRIYRLREFRTVSIRDSADSDAIASRLMGRPGRSRLGRHHRLPEDVADARRREARLLGVIATAATS
jgi:hypothetical protein